MTLGVALNHFELAPDGNAVEDATHLASRAQAFGLGSLWLGQTLSYDAITLAAVVGASVPELAVGTAVTPLHPRHPLVVSGQARVAQAATGGRFSLGLGLGGADLLREQFGSSPAKPIAHLREYLQVLAEIERTGAARFEGETLTARSGEWTLELPGSQPGPSVVVAALGPQVLRATGELADGTVTFLTGPRTIESFIAPTIRAAAEQAGRPAPRVIALVAAVLTDDAEEVRGRAASIFDFYLTLPSYRAVVEREGVGHPVDLALIGDEAALARGVRRLFDAGATEVVLTQGLQLGGAEARLRTWEFAGTLAQQ
ncbi:TIGR03564 family F420-dependent LLM class oxidoreductase [Segniliparus rugosus]|uniref:F420-dependent oxidoreductase n=1 Tax=Segniliparus rugosus (strain ATCC BAA-974 / DSM 45345 / CCUG 50838 / CIP 108380 / JCM 13579 / CDC 945) TaxID=679197 RepID=E5XP49_SEGRC|nr:TIGR03564 family F420-dependent LLM class oxidoreductase [Segniliparus rugosus]EFV13872.1 F420-dependent oxidoreductase [Segniliparus rugosus ATCC BAA-974]